MLSLKLMVSLRGKADKVSNQAESEKTSSSQNSYRQILKSSSIMGGASSFTLVLGMVRTKFAAILIGTTGVGLLANFSALHGMVGTIAGLGIGSSAVRDVSAAVAKEDNSAIGRAVLTLRRMSWLTGMLGLVTMVLLSPFLSQRTFGSNKYTLEIATLGLIVLFNNLSAGQTALIRGMRRVGDLARLTILGAVTVTTLTIPFYFWLGIRGIIPALVLTSATQLVFSWYYARSVPVPCIVMSWKESFHEAGTMVRLGIAMMWTSLVGAVAVYITNALITNQINIQAVGIYSAAFALSGMFVNFVLEAMGADYYPRLTGAADDYAVMNQLVNEQIEVGLLLAVPGLLVTMTLAPWIVRIFYSADFLPAANLLQWFILGCMIRVVQWPMGFLQLALGKSLIWFSTQTLFTLAHLGFIWLGLHFWGIEGVSIAFFSLYIFSLSVIMFVAKHLTNFYWSTEVRRLLLVLLPLVLMTFCVSRLLSVWPATVLGVVVSLVTFVLCLRNLVKRIGLEHRITRNLCRLPGMRGVCGVR